MASAMSFLSFLLPLMWRKCTPLPSGVETAGWTEQEKVSLSLGGGRMHGVVVIYLQILRQNNGVSLGGCGYCVCSQASRAIRH